MTELGKEVIFEAAIENLTCSIITIQKTNFFKSIYLSICKEEKLKNDIIKHLHTKLYKI